MGVYTLQPETVGRVRRLTRVQLRQLQAAIAENQPLEPLFAEFDKTYDAIAAKPREVPES